MAASKVRLEVLKPFSGNIQKKTALSIEINSVGRLLHMPRIQVKVEAATKEKNGEKLAFK